MKSAVVFNVIKKHVSECPDCPDCPDCLLVYGDANSTLPAAKLHIPVVHIEACLSSYNMRMPEEINRILTDTVARILFCPKELSKDSLLKEGYNNMDCDIIVIGDVMYDAAVVYSQF